MQATAIMLASLLVVAVAAAAVSAYSMFTQDVNAKQQQQDKLQNDYLKQFDYGTTTNLTNGTTIRNFTLLAEETHQIPVSAGNSTLDEIIFPAWTYNGTVPGPTMRMTEGDHVFITLVNSPDSKNHHSLHMHSLHSPSMDGTFGQSGSVAPGESFTYQFVAGPTGLYPYHCHVAPILDHINRGLYGAMIIDPKQPREPAVEMVMMMNSYDLDLNRELAPTFKMPTAAQANQIMYPDPQLTPEEQEEARPALEEDRGNELYTINGKAMQYMNDPIELVKGQPVRIYLLSMTEFDPVNSFHLHSGMFNFTASGTMSTPPVLTDIVTLGQGDRGIVEFTPQQTGHMMIHAHVNEFTDLGWMGSFNVVNPEVQQQPQKTLFSQISLNQTGSNDTQTSNSTTTTQEQQKDGYDRGYSYSYPA